MGWDIEDVEREVRMVEAERDALRAALERIGGLLDYWGNSGKPEAWGKCFRAIEEAVEQALKELEEKA